MKQVGTQDTSPRPSQLDWTLRISEFHCDNDGWQSTSIFYLPSTRRRWLVCGALNRLIGPAWARPLGRLRCREEQLGTFTGLVDKKGSVVSRSLVENQPRKLALEYGYGGQL